MKSCTGKKAEGRTQVNGKIREAAEKRPGNSDLEYEPTLSGIKSKFYILLITGAVGSIFSIPTRRTGEQSGSKSGEGNAARQVDWRLMQTHDSSSERQ